MIYLDNAATTSIDPEVQESMINIIRNYFGNPSSIHSLGRECRVIIEEARSIIAKHLLADPSEIYFTSSATEAINTAIFGTITANNLKHIITSPVEHHAVLHSVEVSKKLFSFDVSLLHADKNANIDLSELEELLKKHPKSLVIIMYANNETGTIYPVEEISSLCKNNDAIYLCDMVQGFGKYPIVFNQNSPDISCCSAHKFHGPKGIGFLYLSKNIKITPLLVGGGQERNLRSGTENIYGIVAMAKAFDVAYRDMHKNTEYISDLKKYFTEKLKQNFPDVIFNAACDKGGLYNILNVSFPDMYKNKMLIQHLDMNHIAVSGGSACASGATKASHVLKAIGANTNIPAVRFSLSKYNTNEEIDITISILKKILLGY